MNEQTYHHKDLKAELIEKGLKLLNSGGYEGFSLRKAATLCGVSQTAPYRHFKNKDELIGAITRQALEAFSKRLEDAVAMFPGDPLLQLKEMGVAYVRFFAENPEYLRLLFLSDNQLKTHFGRDFSCHEQFGSFRILRSVIETYAAANPREKRSANELMIYCWGLVHGISTLIAAGELPSGEETLACAERVIRGCL